MPRRDEATLFSWTSKASDTEDARYEWTKSAINAALADWSFDGQSFDVYAKGSYPNHTNVVRDSDVDIAVELTGITNHEFIHGAEGLSLDDVGITPYTGSYDLNRFKNDVELALARQFGRGAVIRGDKAIHIEGSRQRLKADVVVCQTLVSHTSRQGRFEGIRIRPDSGGEIHNYPRQHLAEGIRKNDATQRRYKRIVRILKRLENEMVRAGATADIPSFLIESLVWNLPDRIFNNNPTWTTRISEALHVIHDSYKTQDKWFETNGIKYLFRPTQKWDEAQADKFALAALKYLELI
ncbi:hypothetical protein [Allorhizocola rhizosphaerae]|uniref:hypothetical protein n=1 Tax=Allorhizocola rhizosphaerae TaxID=1872709 RepID=UPI0013C32A09|nr:hypothetical protein [Allorhizocola rhizosphaerae]